MPRLTNLVEYFHARYSVSDRGCWEWNRTLNWGGYGFIRIRSLDFYLTAHRFSYATFVGPIPVGFDVCHTCDNRKCVNPAHLFVGTRFDNMRDCAQKLRSRSRLNPEQVREIRAEISKGRAVLSLARQFSINRSSIYGIAEGKLWTHVAEVAK